MRPAATKLFKGKRLTCLVSKTCTGPGVAKEMVKAIAQDHSENVKHDFTVPCLTELLELPPATFHLLIILLNLRTLFVVAYDLWPFETLIGRHQDHVVQGLLFPVPIANHAGIERHVTPIPHVINACDKGNVLLVS